MIRLLLILFLFSSAAYSAEYAKITRDLQDTGERKEFRNPPPTKEELSEKKAYWVPVEVVDQKPAGKVRSGESIEVQAGKVVVTREYRDKSKAEITSQKRSLALDAWMEDQLMKCTLTECVEYQQEKSR